MARGAADPEIKAKVVAYLETVTKLSKVMAAIGGEKSINIKRAIKELTAEDIDGILLLPLIFV